MEPYFHTYYYCFNIPGVSESVISINDPYIAQSVQQTTKQCVGPCVGTLLTGCIIKNITSIRIAFPSI